MPNPDVNQFISDQIHEDSYAETDSVARLSEKLHMVHDKENTDRYKIKILNYKCCTSCRTV